MSLKDSHQAYCEQMGMSKEDTEEDWAQLQSDLEEFAQSRRCPHCLTDMEVEDVEHPTPGCEYLQCPGCGYKMLWEEDYEDSE